MNKKPNRVESDISYIPERDMTILIEDIYKDGELIATELKAFAYGKITLEEMISVRDMGTTAYFI